MEDKKRICYHGTDAKTAQTILQEGFRKGTYFAHHLENAIGFGGSHIFEVVFSRKTVEEKLRGPKCWQFRVYRRVPPSRIASYKIYKVEAIIENPQLKQEVFESNLTKAHLPV